MATEHNATRRLATLKPAYTVRMRYYLIEAGNAEEKPVDTGDQLEYDGRLAIKAKDLKVLETLKEWIGN